MQARDATESNRTSSPLELLFDLTFVVAIAQIATALAGQLEEGNGASAILPFVMVFFAIWWAWMNFTWFASAFATDDIAYRLLTLVQMGGVLVLAAGVTSAFERQDYFGITLGYIIMRIGLVAQWTRAAVEDRERRRTATRYAIAISVIQLGWLTRLFLPVTQENLGYLAYVTFAVLAILELSVPPWAERNGLTTWHPHHIAERYGLFTIILLGEVVAALSGAVKLNIDSDGTTGRLVAVGVSALVLLFALWWLYFLQPAGDGLERHRGRSFFWGYVHYAVFAALAALGAGLDVVVHFVGGHSELSSVVATYCVAIPVAVYLVFLWLAHAPIVPHLVVHANVMFPTAALVLLLPLLAGSTGVPVALALVVATVVGCVVVTVIVKDRALRRLALSRDRTQ
jgi:low temperature requirement protein LtrA